MSQAEPSRMPDNWRAKPIRDLVSMESSGTWGVEANPEQGGVIVLRSTNLTKDGRLNLSDVALRNIPSRDRSRKAIKPGDIVLERSGGGPGQPVGRVARIPALGEVYCSNFCQLLRADDSVVSPGYLYRLLWNLYETGLTARLQHATTGIRNLDYGAYLSIVVAVPPPSEQQRIACILDSIDGAIEKTEAVIEQTERLRQGLLQELLTHGLPGRHSEWKHVLSLGLVPACWEVVALGEVAEVQTGRAVNQHSQRESEVSVPYLSVANVKDGYLDLSLVKEMKVAVADLARFGLREGDVLFTEGGDADKVGRGAVWRSEISPCLHQNHVFAVRPDRGRLLADYLNTYGGSPLGKGYFLRAAKQTTNLASINASQLKELPIVLPPLAEQEAIEASLGQLDDALKGGRDSLESLTALKASVADALLTGRVRVQE